MKICKLKDKPKGYNRQLLDKWTTEVPFFALEQFYKYGKDDKAVIVVRRGEYNIFTLESKDEKRDDRDIKTD